MRPYRSNSTSPSSRSCWTILEADEGRTLSPAARAPMRTTPSVRAWRQIISR